MKKLMFCVLMYILLVSVNQPLLAQDETTISGKVIDGTSKYPLPFVSILIKSKTDSSEVGGGLTDERGRFTIAGLAPGSYHMQCSFVGYGTLEMSVMTGVKNQFYDLGTIEMKSVTTQLDEVVIAGSNEIVSGGLDKKSFDMDENVAQSGGSVLDAMRSLPGIIVDQDGKVLLRGSDRVVILMDGKQSSLTGFGNQKGLDNIPAANIESIEIINNPSAKYDAAGMAGIINIIYKKEKETGFNGDIGLALGVGQLSKRKEDLPTSLGSFQFNPKVIPSLNLNYRTPALHAFLQSEVMYQQKLPNNEFTTRHFDDGTTIYSQVPENRTQTQYIVKGGLDWTLDDRNTLSFSSVFDYEHHIDTAQVPFIFGTDGARQRYWAWSESEITGFLNFSLDYKHQFDQPGHELSTSVQYTRGWEDESYYLSDSSSVRISKDTTHLIATEHTIPVTLDYVKPLRNGRLETGLMLRFRSIPVTYDVGKGDKSVIYPGLGDWSEWKENIYAAYLNYILEKEHYDVEAGLRLEHTDVAYELPEENIYYSQNDAYSYFRPYPNIRLTGKINDNNNVSVFYNNRVDRPGEPELRIFPKYDDPELLKVGNPYLRPQFTQTFELAWKHMWNTGSLYLSGYHRIIDDHFQRIYSADTSNQNYDIVNKIYQNVGRATNTGIEVLLTQEVGEIWKINSSFNWYTNIIDGHEGIMLFPYERPFTIEKTKDATWDLKIANQFRLPNSLQLQLTWIYYAPKNIPQGRQFARSSVDIGAKKKVLNDNVELSFSLTDLFNRFGIKQEINGDGFTAVYENYLESQVVRLGMVYKF